MRIFARGVRGLYAQNIQFRLTCYFLILLLPLAAISMYAIEQSKNILYDQAIERSHSALSSTMDNLDLTLQNVEQLSTIIATDADMIAQLKASGAALSPKSVIGFAQILDKLSTVKLSNQFVRRVSVYHEASRTLLTTGYGSRQLAEGERQWLSETLGRIGTGILYQNGDGGVPRSAADGQSLLGDGLTLVRSMDLYNQRRAPNALLLSLDQAQLVAMARSLLPSPNAYVSLYGQDGSLIVGDGSAATAAAAKRHSAGLLSVSIRSNYSNWQMTIVQPKREVFRKTESIQGYMYLIVALSVALAFIIPWTVHKGIASPVKKLMKGMKQISAGNLDVSVDYKREDELGFLTKSFNQMARYQKHLIENHYEQQLLLAQTELKFLQSQINPHFLYNTLDSIYWTSKNYEAEEIGEMVLHLSKFFRLSLNKGKDVITVQESVEHLHDYVRIQQLKSLDSFEVDYRIEPAAREVPIMKLLLQPLVENAILHGMEGLAEDGKLIVGGRTDGDWLVLEVRDNGKGIPPERLEYIRGELERIKRRNVRSLSLLQEETVDLFGLRNVMTRIRLCYGPEADMTVDGAEDGGTTVKVTLPLARCRHDIYARAALDEENPRGAKEELA